MTLLIASIEPEQASDLSTLAEKAWRAGADAVEIRIDAFEGEPGAINEFLLGCRGKRWIITCRSSSEGGAFHGDLMRRVSFLLAAARGTDAIVDFEIADWATSANVRQKVGLAAASTKDGAPRVILSSHDFQGPISDPAARIEQALAIAPRGRVIERDFTREGEVRSSLADPVDPAPSYDSASTKAPFPSPMRVAKIAYRAADAIGAFPALDAMRRHGSRCVAIAMGDDASWTRVLAGKLGAFATFASLDTERGTAPGQLTIDAFVGDFRWRDITPATRVFGLLGDPVAQSMGPIIMNRWFRDANLDAVYLPIRVAGGRPDALAAFLHECRKRPWLDVDGFSVTIPHKAAALEYAGAGADSMSRSIGAANTLVFRDGNALAHNTDAYAALDSLAAALGVRRTRLAGLAVDVLGSGGAARALVFGLREFGCEVTVYARTFDKAEALGREYGFDARPWERRALSQGDILVNTTSVGMWPAVNESPMPTESLRGRRLVFDMIYNPLRTRLLADAQQEGVPILGGLDMFIRQAATQFALWTGATPDAGIAARWVEERLGERRRAGT